MTHLQYKTTKSCRGALGSARCDASPTGCCMPPLWRHLAGTNRYEVCSASASISIVAVYYYITAASVASIH
ncbi:hypothetical protein BO83DRAFT_379383, partial [Aspergillus eucalypticola CBS 122712]